MSTVDEVLAVAMAFPPGDRAARAGRLLESVDDAVQAGPEDHLEQTILDRLAAYDWGEVEAAHWEDVKVRIETSLDRKRPA